MFGETLQGPVAEIVVRNWGVLIGLVGAMLIYGAFNPPVRPLVLTVAGVSKVVFIGLALGNGLGRQMALSIAIDLVAAALFVGYFVAMWRSRAAP